MAKFTICKGNPKPIGSKEKKRTYPRKPGMIEKGRGEKAKETADHIKKYIEFIDVKQCPSLQDIQQLKVKDIRPLLKLLKGTDIFRRLIKVKSTSEDNGTCDLKKTFRQDEGKSKIISIYSIYDKLFYLVSN